MIGLLSNEVWERKATAEEFAASNETAECGGESTCWCVAEVQVHRTAMGFR